MRRGEALSAGEDVYRRRLRAFEGTPLFRALRDEGLLVRAAWRGWIPPEEHRDHLERTAVPLAERYGLDERPGWIDRLAASEPAELDSLARAWRIPLDDLRTLRRYAALLAEERRDDPPSASSEAPELGVEWLARFVRQHGLSPDDLRRWIVEDTRPIEEAGRALGIPEREVARARARALDILLAGGPEAEPVGGVPDPPVATLVLTEGTPRWAVGEDSTSATAYRLREGGIERLRELAGSTEEAREFVGRIREANERQSLLCRVLAELLRAQWSYLGSGERERLAPLTQAELARRLGEDRSVLCRLLRGKRVATPWGEWELRELLPSRREVVARLLERMPEASDRAVAEALAARHGLRLGRRAIAYHRLAIAKARKE